MAASDPSFLNSNYVLPPDFDVMTETAEVFTRALLLGMTLEINQNNFAEPLPEEFLPYEEAVAYMSKRLPVDRETYYALSDKMRYRAFTVSRLADGDAVRHIQSMLTNAMEQGTGMSEFLQMTEGQLADAAGMGKGAGWYYETVYRTNTSTAYNVGRAIGFEEVPPIALELIGIDDDRQTETCHSLTSPPFRRPYDDPVWDTMWPPFHFNCRTTVRAIYDQSEIDDAGGEEKFYSKSNPDYKPAEGFGKYPIEKSDSWWDLTDAMRDRAQEYGLTNEFEQAKEKLIEQESENENNLVNNLPDETNGIIIDEEKIAETLKEAESSIMFKEHEEAVVISPDGRIVYKAVGGDHEVGVPAQHAKNNIVTHNHPTYIHSKAGTTFTVTEGDIDTLIKDDLFRLRAVTRDGYYVQLEKIGTDHLDKNLADAMREAGLDQNDKRLMDMVWDRARKEYSPEDFRNGGRSMLMKVEFELINEWLKENAYKYGYIFTQGRI